MQVARQAEAVARSFRQRARGRTRLGAQLLAEALLGLGLGIGEYALISGAPLLLAVLPAAPGR